MTTFRPHNNENGVMLLGLSLAIIAIFAILIFAIQNNMQLFLASSNKMKAFYDAEIAIEKVAVKLRDAYDLARPVAPKLALPAGSVIYAFDNLANLKPTTIKKLYLPGSKFCVDRSDGFAKDSLGAFQICIDYVNDLEYFQINPVFNGYNWPQIKDAFEYAIYKLINDIAGPSVAYAQEMTVYRPEIKNPTPKVTLNLNAATTSGDLLTYYDNFNCVIGGAGNVVSDCFRFKICTKLTACKALEDYVYQTIVFRHGPQTDIEN